MPFSTVARQATHLQGQHQADAILRHVGEETLKPGAVFRASSAQSEVVINHHHTRRWPTKCRGAVPQRILARERFTMFGHLVWRRLPHVDDRLTLQVARPQFGRTTILPFGAVPQPRPMLPWSRP